MHKTQNAKRGKTALMERKIFGLGKNAAAGILAVALAAALSGILFATATVLSAAAAAGDGAGTPINVFSREEGSGTRGAFVELLGITQKTADGQTQDLTTQTAAITNSNAAVLTSVASDPAAIGYISLGTLNDSVRALTIDGAYPTAAAIHDGTYTLARPFNAVTRDTAALSDAARDFLAFVQSDRGQQIVESAGYIGNTSAPKYTTGEGEGEGDAGAGANADANAGADADGSSATAKSTLSGKVVVAGSSSVAPVMEKLAEAYRALHTQVAIEVQVSDSTTGVNMALDGTADIGMASRDLKTSEIQSGATATAIAQDGIAVVVSPQNPTTGLTREELKQIYTGELTVWPN